MWLLSLRPNGVINPQAREPSFCCVSLSHPSRKWAEAALHRHSRSAGITFKSLAVPWASTDNPAAELMLTVGIAQFERGRIRERKLMARASHAQRQVGSLSTAP